MRAWLSAKCFVCLFVLDTVGRQNQHSNTHHGIYLMLTEANIRFPIQLFIYVPNHYQLHQRLHNRGCLDLREGLCAALNMVTHYAPYLLLVTVGTSSPS